jgi:hypothetical protein
MATNYSNYEQQAMRSAYALAAQQQQSQLAYLKNLKNRLPPAGQSQTTITVPVVTISTTIAGSTTISLAQQYVNGLSGGVNTISPDLNRENREVDKVFADLKAWVLHDKSMSTRLKRCFRKLKPA